MSKDALRAWEDKTKAPRERAQALVAAMSLDQKIAQVHGAMETIDI
jgi:beta-glucosidase